MLENNSFFAGETVHSPACRLTSAGPGRAIAAMKRRTFLHGLAAGTGAALLNGPYALGQAPARQRLPGKVVATQYGQVRGYIDQNIFAYKGIPYGDDTAKHRFQAPRPPQPWSLPMSAPATARRPWLL